jgi:hypothetical protein
MNETLAIEEMIKRVEAEDLTGYGHWPLPCPVDNEMSTIVNAFLHATPTEREAVYGKVKDPFLFLAFSRRMAILGVRERSERRLFEGLIAHAIEDFKSDARENLIELSLLYHSASRIGLDPAELFQRAAAFATPEAAKYILGFINRNPELRKIETMRFRETMTPEGFSYERIRR